MNPVRQQIHQHQSELESLRAEESRLEAEAREVREKAAGLRADAQEVGRGRSKGGQGKDCWAKS